MGIDEAIKILRYHGRDAARDLECGLLLATEVERLRAIEKRLRELALRGAGPQAVWAAQMIAIRREDVSPASP